MSDSPMSIDGKIKVGLNNQIGAGVSIGDARIGADANCNIGRKSEVGIGIDLSGGDDKMRVGANTSFTLAPGSGTLASADAKVDCCIS